METTRRDLAPATIRLLFEVGTVAGLSDGQLLDRFLDRRADEEVAEIAFAALVERHGPMVLRACRARLGDEHDAQDAFQATFLILARKAGSIRKQDSASSWLQGVARRVATCARRQAALRRAKERAAAGRTAEAVDDPDRGDLVPAVREEVGGLPEKYRTPLILCLLDGLTHEEAATRLGWPVGTVKTRVRHAKDRLRTRLARRGLAPSLAAIGGALAAQEASAMPAALVRATTRAALSFATNPGVLSTSVAALVQLGLGSLIMTRWKVAALVITSVGALAAGANGLARQSQGPRVEGRPDVVRPAMPDEPKPVAVVAEDEILDQLEMARLNLEIRRKTLESFKQGLIQIIQTLDGMERNLKAIQSAKDLDELRRYDSVRMDEEFDLARKRIEASSVKAVDKLKVNLEMNRKAYIDQKRELRREEQRVKDMEDRATHASLDGPSPGSKGPGETGAAEQGRDDRIEATKLDVELLRMEVEGLRQNVMSAQQAYLLAKAQSRSVGAPPDPRIKGPASLLRQRPDDESPEDAKKKARDYLIYLEEKLAGQREEFLSRSRDLRREERRLQELAEGLPWSRPAEVLRSSANPQRAAEAKPTADVDRRLSDVEWKLDLILKAVENQGREAGKK